MLDIVNLPNSAFPKPGEKVVWFSQNTLVEGDLLGYDVNQRPIIMNQFNLPDQTNSFDTIRPKDPNNRIQPNWLRLPTGGKLFAAEQVLADAIETKLNERIPPGPSYLELITEMYYRGYETYLVGGTVRDFIQGVKSNDIDLVTTMPLKSAIPLIESMFNKKYSYHKENGFVRIGGTPASGDPFIDVKNFLLTGSGAGSKIFGSEIEYDLKIRDFSCNAIYYDPINKRIVDPSGHGVEDAKEKRLMIVKDRGTHSPAYSGGQLLIRLIKFAIRGYSCPAETIELAKQVYSPLLVTLDNSRRMNYIKAQVLSKVSANQKKDTYDQFVIQMKSLGFEEEYTVHIQPFEMLLNL